MSIYITYMSYLASEVTYRNFRKGQVDDIIDLDIHFIDSTDRAKTCKQPNCYVHMTYGSPGGRF